MLLRKIGIVLIYIETCLADVLVNIRIMDQWYHMSLHCLKAQQNQVSKP